jgi:Cof subfamily protein (haloacid dehalogenase superfamily)
LKYLLLAADLDGTLIGDDMRLSPRLKAALREVQERGIKFTIATGRTPDQTLPFAEELNVHTPLICGQGGLIFDRERKRILHRTSLPLPLLREAVHFARERELLFLVSDNEGVYVDDLGPFSKFYRQITRVLIREVGDLVAFFQHEPLKFLIYAEPEEMPELVAALERRFDHQLQIIRTHLRILEGIPLGVSKGRALAFLADYLGVPRQATAAIGDQDNDADMVAWAGLGVAMQGGSEAVKRAADIVAPPLAEDGAAQIIEHYLLGR